MPDIGMIDPGVGAVLVLLPLCLIVEKMLKGFLSRDQFDYMRDNILFLVLGLVAIWSGSAPVRAVVICSLLAGIIGIAGRFYRLRGCRLLYFAVGILLAFMGPRIQFVGLPGGQYHYLSDAAAVMVTACWVGVFPLLMMELDRVPGLGGHVLAVALSLMLLVSGASGQNLSDAFLLSLCGVGLLVVFWSRHGHSFRTLGEPLAGMWGILIAGVSILGVSKGITFTAMMILPLGLFAIPFLEASLNFCSRFVPAEIPGGLSLYHRFIDRGIDHPSAVRLVAALCAILGLGVAFFQISVQPGLRAVSLGGVLFLGGFVLSTFGKGQSSVLERRPLLWGIELDNISLNYALGKCLAWARSGQGAHYVVTLDALAAFRTRSDAAYRRAVCGASLVLVDGKGLQWGLRLLGKKIQQRVAGIDFMDSLCRSAAATGIPVYFLGGKPGVAEKAARALCGKYPRLDVRGAAHGYFGPDEEESAFQTVRESGARILFLGLGVPRQEILMNSRAEVLGDLVVLGIGGSFDVLSGNLKRAPQVWQKCGAEWLYRLIQEPWRLRRVAKLPLFVFTVMLTRLKLDRWRDERLDH